MLLGFDAMEKTLERLAKSGDSYPPYNIERLRGGEGRAETGCALPWPLPGSASSDLEVTTEENQLVVRGRQNDDTAGVSFCIAASPPVSSSASSCWPTG